MPVPVKPPVPMLKAAEVCQRFEPSADARRLLDNDLLADTYLARLIEQGLYAEGLQFLAHWLPKREAVWWGCLCIWKVARPEPADKAAAALRSAVRWVLDPSEPNRRAAEAAGKAAGVDTPEGAIALAVVTSGGSLSAPELPEAAPPPYLTAKTLVAALRATAVRDRPEDQSRPKRLFLQLGQDVASGHNRWELGS